MATIHTLPGTDITLHRKGTGHRAVIFVHGFLDDLHLWDPVIANLSVSDIETVQVDLPGCGQRVAAPGPYTYERLAADLSAVITAVAKPFVLVGQSMGAAVAELAAIAHPDTALGLALLTPIPLAGTGLPDEAIAPFRALGELGPDNHRAVRRQLAPAFPATELERIVAVGRHVRPDVVAAYADCWNGGHPAGASPSSFTGPVLIMSGANDGFVTAEALAAGVTPRFPAARFVAVEGSGHWPHAEQPAAVAAQLSGFLGSEPACNRAAVTPLTV